MPLSTEQLLLTAKTLEKALSEIAFLTSQTPTQEQEIFLIYIETLQLNLLNYLSKLPANFYAKHLKPLMPHQEA